MDGELRQSLDLPPAWQQATGRGIPSNGGPESLTQAPGTGALLMAAEQPPLKDPPDRVRLLLWEADATGNLQPRTLRPLALPPGGWGLTDLLATRQGLLGLWRRFTAPDQWQARLVLYPPLADGRASLVLASDDNFNPLQRTHLARLVPRRLPDCPPPPPR